MMKKAGYDILGYEPGREKEPMSIANAGNILPLLSRPQSAPTELMLELGDAGIIGSDWVEETQGVGGRQILEVLDLEYGKTRLVFAASEKYSSLDEFVAEAGKSEKGILCFSEYMNTAANALSSCNSYKSLFGAKEPMKLARGMRSGDNGKVRVVLSDGVTEGYVAKGANLVLDNSQSGNTMEKYGLQILEETGTSSARLYARAAALANPWCRYRIDELSRQLAGVVEGSRKYYVMLNVPGDRVSGLVGYARSNCLFADEPTIVAGKDFCQVGLLVPKANWPKLSQGLVAVGARNIVRFEPDQVLGGLPC